MNVPGSLPLSDPDFRRLPDRPNPEGASASPGEALMDEPALMPPRAWREPRT